jgi:arylsulfatase A-like enzyme
MFVGLGVTASHPESSIAQTAPPPNPPPNIIFILTDDMRASDLQYMPNVQRLLVDQGTKFTKAWVTRSLCCPSRATTLRGQYTHNHDMWDDTDLHAQTADNFIKRKAGLSSPFFMYLAPNAPHHPSYFADRHADMFSDTRLPRPSSFNEADVSDKPQWVRNKSFRQ